MSRYKYLLFSLVTFAVFTSSVSAATCSYEERAQLNSEVANITANYEIVETEVRPSADSLPDVVLGTEYEEDFVIMLDTLQVNVLNLTENVYVEVTNDYDENTAVYTYADTENGNLAIPWERIDTLVTFVIEVYSSEETGCEGTLLKTIRLSLPRQNEYAQYTLCNQVPDYYLCQQYVTFDEIDFGEFIDRISTEINNRMEQDDEGVNGDDAWYEEVGNFISEHWVAITIVVVSIVVVAGVVVAIIVIIRRRNII